MNNIKYVVPKTRARKYLYFFKDILRYVFNILKHKHLKMWKEKLKKY